MSKSPSRVSRRLLENGYYYNEEDPESSYEDDSRSDVSVESLTRRLKYKGFSPSKRKRGARILRTPQSEYLNSVLIPSGKPSRTPSEASGLHKGLITHVTHEKKVEYSSDHTKTTTRVNRRTTETRNYKKSTKPMTAHLQVDHLFGLEESGEGRMTSYLSSAGDTNNVRRRGRRSPHTPQLLPVYVQHPPSATNTTKASVESRVVKNCYSDSDTATSYDNNKSSHKSLSKRSKKQKIGVNISYMSRFLYIFIHLLTFPLKHTLSWCKYWYQSVCLMICANSWLSTARHKSVTSFNFLMTYLIRMVACGIFIMVLLQITSFLPQYSPKVQVVSITGTKSGPLSFSQKFLSYFTSSDTSQKQEIKRNKMTEKVISKLNHQQKHLVDSMKILESSFSLLQHEFSQQNDKNKKIEDKFKDNKINTEILMSNIQENIKGDFSEKSSRIYSELENYKVVVDELDKKVEKLKDQFKLLSTSTSSKIDALESNADRNSESFNEQIKLTQQSIHSSNKQIDEIKSRLVELKDISNAPKSDVVLKSEVEEIIEKRFIESFILLLKSTYDDGKVESTKYTRLASIFLQWLDSKEFISKQEFNTFTSNNLTAEVKREISIKMQQVIASQASQFQKPVTTKTSSPGLSVDTIRNMITSTAGSQLTEQDVKKMISQALDTYSADRLGLADYALETAGGHIVSTRCSETYEYRTAQFRIFGIPLYFNSNTPRSILQPSVMPGECWAFKGSKGYVVVGLSVPIYISSVTIEHIPKSVALLNTSSAPQNFSVFALNHPDDIENEVNLGNFTFTEENGSLQNFPVSSDNRVKYSFVELRVSSNWGNPDFTCLYRFRVHGTRE